VEVVTYWQVYLFAVVGALAAFWADWGSCWRYQRRALAAALESRGRHAAGPGRPPAPLPELPAAAAAMIDVRHANAMATTAPRDPSPLQRARARVGALVAALDRFAAARLEWESARPWGDDTGTFTALVGQQDSDQGQAAA
jgi:hypothetical protein